MKKANTYLFANNVKKYRMKKGLSQEAFAEKAGLHRTYISAIEREKRSIALDNVQKIADALEIETYLLFIDIETEKKKKKGGILENEKL
jgi:transcriptional regulator with XRE-family HTH domain